MELAIQEPQSQSERLAPTEYTDTQSTGLRDLDLYLDGYR